MQHYLTLPLNAVLELNLLPTQMSTVHDKGVLSQGFGEQVSNLIIGADSENFDFPMMDMDMFTKMMITYIGMLCVKSKFEEQCKF